MIDEQELKKISAKLNIIVSLLMDLKQSMGEKMQIKEKVKYIVRRKIIEDEDISAILDITKSHASKEKAILKKEEIENGR